MIEWVLDRHYGALHAARQTRERSIIVFGAMESTLTPLMVRIEAEYPGIKVFSLPSVDHPQWGRHIELGVKGDADSMAAAFARMRNGLVELGAELGPELVR
jgi:molybdopterin-biosynthesis enzyme MoeA-like protein